MLLDATSLRVAFAAVALTVLVLSWISFRRSRASYSIWWCLGLLFFMIGSGGYLLDGTDHQVWANPSANALLVAGGASVWAGARSLRTGAHLPRRRGMLAQLFLLPVVTLAVSAFDSPASNDWSGGPVFLAAMAITFALASVQMWWLPSGYSRTRLPLAATTTLLALFYCFRCVAFIAVGPDATAFRTFFGSEVTTIITMMVLVVISSTVSDVSTEQMTRELRTRATRDGLTGVLNRTGFLDFAEGELRRMQRTGKSGSLIMADLDNFKAVNDTWGHHAGDEALRAFADACRGSVRSTDLVGRYGGEEFILLLPGVSPRHAESVTSQVSRHMLQLNHQFDFQLPTASYGIASVEPHNGILAATTLADAALYQAKRLGRNQTVCAPNITTGEDRSRNRRHPANTHHMCLGDAGDGR